MVDSSVSFRRPWNDLKLILADGLKKFFEYDKLDYFITEAILLFSYLWCQKNLIIEVSGGELTMDDYLKGTLKYDKTSFVSIRSKEFDTKAIIEELIMFLVSMDMDPRIDQKNKELFDFFKKKILLDSMLELDIPLDEISITQNKILALYQKTGAGFRKIEGIPNGDKIFPKIEPYLDAFENNFLEYNSWKNFLFVPREDLSLEF